MSEERISGLQLWFLVTIPLIWLGAMLGMGLDEVSDSIDNAFSEDIRRYIGVALDTEGIVTPPDVLKLGIRETQTGEADFGGFSEDPGMFEAEFGSQKLDADEITDMLKSNLQEMFLQLDSLKLVYGDTDELLSRIRKQLID